MIRSVLLGLVAGARSMTPLAAVSLAARLGRLPRDNGAPALLSRPLVSAGAAALAVGELLGDKMRSAPDRIVAPGMAARLLTGAIAGAAVADRQHRRSGAALGALAATASAYVTFAARMKALRRVGQTRSGLVEDAIAVGSALLLVAGAARSRPRLAAA